ncbi:MAG: phosphohydrolase, partial [Sulfolobaceae archaeon]
TLLGDLPKWATDRLPQKEEIEKEAIKQLGLGEELFEEYKNRSLEGQIAKLSEMLATYLQAKRYLRQGYDVKEIMETYFSVLQEMKRRSPFNLIENQIDFLINDLIK